MTVWPQMGQTRTASAPQVSLALHALERAVVDGLVVLLRRQGVADAGLRGLVLLQLGDGVVGGVHLVDLEGLAAPGRLEVLLRRPDAAEHAQVVAGVGALGERDGAEEPRDVGVALGVGDVGEREVLLRGLALAGERGGDVRGRHLALALGGGRGVLEGFGHRVVLLL